jgi:magnesium transporter
MIDDLTLNKNLQDKIYFLTDIIGIKVYLKEKKIGKLTDILITETSKIPEVTHFLISRPFGYPSLIIPFDKITKFEEKEISIDIDDLVYYEGDLSDDIVRLKDHILDKKVIDIEENEVEVVYDVKMALRNGKLYVTDVDFSRFGLLRRMGLKRFAYFIYKLAFIEGAKSLYSKKHKYFANLLISLANKIKERTIPWTYIQSLPTNISRFKGNVKLNILKERLSDISPADLADILEELDHEQRVAVFEELEPEHASDTLEEINPNVQRELISSLKIEKVVSLIDQMTPAQAADVLYSLPTADANEILNFLSPENANKVKSIFEKQDEKILNYSTLDILKYPPEWNALQTMIDYKTASKSKDVTMYLYIVNEQDKLLGIVNVKNLLQSEYGDLLKDIMVDSIISLNPDSTLKEAFEMFTRYGFRAIPILDENESILGVIPYRDIMNLKHRFLE